MSLFSYGVAHCCVFDSLHTILFPVNSFAVSSLLDYLAVADAFIKSKTTLPSTCLVQLRNIASAYSKQMPPGC